MIKMIAAVSQNGILGIDGKIPWHYSSDFKRFKELTLNSTIIMGRKTFESIGSKPLPKRRNIVITSSNIDGIECCNSVTQFMMNPSLINGNIWLIGGHSIYEEGMNFASEIDLTIVPDFVDPSQYKNVVRFPWINPLKFELASIVDGQENLKHLLYKRK